MKENYEESLSNLINTAIDKTTIECNDVLKNKINGFVSASNLHQAILKSIEIACRNMADLMIKAFCEMNQK